MTSRSDVRAARVYAHHLHAIPSSDEPPLGSDGALPDRRAVSLRWMAATMLMGAAAVVLFGGALRAVLGDRAQFAMSPVVSLQRLAQMVDEARRGDRLDRKSSKDGNSSAIRIEQLGDAGSVRPFTRVSARLAEIDPEDGEAPAADDSNKPHVLPQDAPPSQASPIKLGSSSRHALSGSVSSYADDAEAPASLLAIGKALNVSSVPKSLLPSDSHRHVVIARQGDTLAAILHAVAAGTEDEPAILAAFPWPGARGPLSGGEKIKVTEQTADAAAPRGHILKVSIALPDASVFAVGRTDAGDYQAIAPEQPGTASHNAGALRDTVDTRLLSGESLRDGLNALARSNHVDEAVVAELMRLCGRDFDLDEPLGEGDLAKIIYAPNELGQPELVFVDLTAAGQTHRYYRFNAPDDGSSDFYDEAGHSITKFLLRKPVVNGRLGDGFGWRIHPILGDRRFHEGVDFAAPFGSPIAAAGAGVVETFGFQRGYGKYVRLLHDRGYETTYAHVANFPHGLKVGDRVRQGETIAYVGSTGLSTGPHLYYEVRINGRNVDPFRIKLSGGRVLQGDVLGAFDRRRDGIDQLAGLSAPSRPR
ncbi:M23 family metallopeptidase [Bradyrhizobium genosp. L]|uniref:M23 family metallopeptidase n=1 Tax=Bradyrhizobium genosp. L TaxID=83637 RepID=UPI0018A2ECD2|nr:M23 family metallopeptidase [Bradyrhizobium genosp. L]QPF84597.1 M23 family metallopeptidase [Bradyrhizobium genosp. L]